MHKNLFDFLKFRLKFELHSDGNLTAGVILSDLLAAQVFLKSLQSDFYDIILTHAIKTLKAPDESVVDVSFM